VNRRELVAWIIGSLLGLGAGIWLAPRLAAWSVERGRLACEAGIGRQDLDRANVEPR
jgi:hypothetical protein